MMFLLAGYSAMASAFYALVQRKSPVMTDPEDALTRWEFDANSTFLRAEDGMLSELSSSTSTYSDKKAA